MGKIASSLSDLAVVTSDNPRTEDPAGILREVEAGIGADSRKYSPEDIVNGFDEKGYLVIDDRRAAIELAISVAGRSDIVLVAGKGHEDYQIVGTRKIPFDDKTVVKETLSRRGSRGMQ